MTTKPTTLISTRLKQLLDERLLTQGEFAWSIEISLERVRNMTCNRIKKLTTKEKQAIKAVYNINPDWLDTEDAEKQLPSNTPVLIAKHDDFAVFIIARLITDLSKNGPVSQALNALISDYRK
jgi:hypothetical protein